nr:MAG TPA: hypothetical protein [Caudoviricetes sp.]
MTKVPLCGTIKGLRKAPCMTHLQVLAAKAVSGASPEWVK